MNKQIDIKDRSARHRETRHVAEMSGAVRLVCLVWCAVLAATVSNATSINDTNTDGSYNKLLVILIDGFVIMRKINKNKFKWEMVNFGNIMISQTIMCCIMLP